MKRFICVLLAAATLLSLCACNSSKKQAKDKVIFYYPRNEISYGEADGVIASEAREAQGYTDNLQSLILLYLQGPVSSDLRSPFPLGMQVEQAEQDGETVNIVLGSSLDNLSSLEKTLACACLTMTCLGLSDAVTVSISTVEGIQAGEKPIIMDSSCLLLLDDSAADPTEETA